MCGSRIDTPTGTSVSLEHLRTCRSMNSKVASVRVQPRGLSLKTWSGLTPSYNSQPVHDSGSATKRGTSSPSVIAIFFYFGAAIEEMWFSKLLSPQQATSEVASAKRRSELAEGVIVLQFGDCLRCECIQELGACSGHVVMHNLPRATRDVGNLRLRSVFCCKTYHCVGAHHLISVRGCARCKPVLSNHWTQGIESTWRQHGDA